MRSYNIVAHADSGPCSWMQAFQIQISRCCSRSTKNVWKLSILTLMCLQLQITKFLGSIEHRGNYFAILQKLVMHVCASLMQNIYH